MKEKLSLGQGRKFGSQEPEATVAKPTVEPVKKPKPVHLDAPVGAVAVQSFTLSGVTHSGYPFAELYTDQEVKLVFDPYGQVVKPSTGHPDPYAISVQDNDGQHIGYLKTAVAAVVYKALDSGKFTYLANVELIKGGYDGLNWGVDITVKFYTKLKRDS